MFDALITAPTHSTPWPWAQVDDVIAQYYTLAPHFEALCEVDNTSNTLDNTIYTMENGRMQDPVLVDWLADAQQWLDAHIEQVLAPWPQHRRFPAYKGEVQITRQAPAPYRFPVHDESRDKCWSAVIYCAPQHGTGTTLYHNIKGTGVQPSTAITMDKRWGTAPWRCNSAFIFAGKDSVTWHDYEGIIDQHRITVNLFIKRNNK